MLLGSHCFKEKGYINNILSNIERVKKTDIHYNAVQIFIQSPREWKLTIPPEEQKDFKKFIEKKHISLITHSAYINSLFSDNAGTENRSLANIKREIRNSINIGAKGLVIHLRCINYINIIERLDKLEDVLAGNFLIYLEIIASTKQDNNYAYPTVLNKLYTELAKKPYFKNIGLCIDTAHLWSSGINISSAENIKKWFNEVNFDIIDINKVIIHLNDNEKKMGVVMDKHTFLLKGKIWKTDNGGLIWLIKFILKHKLITILERKENDDILKDYNVISNIITELQNNNKRKKNKKMKDI